VVSIDARRRDSRVRSWGSSGFELPADALDLAAIPPVAVDAQGAGELAPARFAVTGEIRKLGPTQVE
jgi:hypothetical protein